MSAAPDGHSLDDACAATASDADAAAFESLVIDIDDWVSRFGHWHPMRAIRDDWSEAGARLAGVGRELSRLLVVGVIGGTGTGKSTLVNALAGEEVSLAGDVMRPTTKHPVVVAAEGADCSWLPAADWGAKIVRTAAPAVAGIILVDCPDPDTQDDGPIGRDPPSRSSTGLSGASEVSMPNRNREILETVLPSCDVLLLVSTAQKYRSWAVAREVARFAPGRPLLFVQTHASRDPDIRDDWRLELAREGIDAPVIHRLDGVEAIRRTEKGLPPEPGFAGLCAAIGSELAGRAAGRVRRTGAVDLMDWFLRRSASRLAGLRAPLDAFAAGIESQRMRLETVLSERLATQLVTAKRDWRRLLGRELVGEGRTGPFAAFLSVVEWLVAAWPGMARGGTGLVARVLAGQSVREGQPPGSADSASTGPPPAALRAEGMAAIHDVGLNEGEVEQSRSILVGLAARARIEEPQVGRARLTSDKAGAAVVEVLARGRVWLEQGITRLVESRRVRTETTLVRWTLEIAFGGFVVAVVGRAAWGFFHDRLWAGRPSTGGGLLWEAVPWVVLWGLGLRWIAGAWVRRGLEADVRRMLAGLPQARLVDPVLEDFAIAARDTAEGLAAFDTIVQRAGVLASVRTDTVPGLGRLRREGIAERPELPGFPSTTEARST